MRISDWSSDVCSSDLTWQCPLTRRVLPRLVFGRSPNLVTTGTGRFDGKIVTAVEFPKLPYTRPLNSEAKQRLADWLADNELVRSLRSQRLWTDIHDQAARATPYLRAEEHSTQQPPPRPRALQEQFKPRDMHHQACSTKMG